MRVTLRLVASLVFASSVLAQVDVVTQARELARAGNQTEAVRLLERRLIEQPNDNDARTLYGTILSWQRQFDRARVELERVLRDEPGNLDARLALIRVELWSGRTVQAERLTAQSLEMFPANADLIALRSQARSRDHGNEVSAGVNYDDYSESDSWQEGFVSLKIATRAGAVIGRMSRAERFDLDDSQFDVEAYPRLGSRTYAYLSAGLSADGVLYPDWRYGAELYHTFPHALEVSAGMRRLNFDDAVNVYTASLGKYAGNWLLGARVYDAEDETAVFAIVRRYFGEHGQYVGLRAGQGAREEIRSSTDLDALNVREIAVETRLALTNQWMVNARAGFGEETVSTSLAVGFSF